jgi:hypothetical protein
MLKHSQGKSSSAAAQRTSAPRQLVCCIFPKIWTWRRGMVLRCLEGLEDRKISRAVAMASAYPGARLTRNTASIAFKLATTYDSPDLLVSSRAHRQRSACKWQSVLSLKWNQNQHEWWPSSKTAVTSRTPPSSPSSYLLVVVYGQDVDGSQRQIRASNSGTWASNSCRVDKGTKS